MNGNINEFNETEQADRSLAQALQEYQDLSVQDDAPTWKEFLQAHPEAAGKLREEFGVLDDLDAFLDDEPPRQKFGDFEVMALAGRGAMGVVYEAWQNSLERRVALKILPPSFAEDAKSVQRFRREARIAGRLSHSNIVPVFAMGVEDGIPYYAMEYADGATLSRMIRHLRIQYGIPGPTDHWDRQKTPRADTEDSQWEPTDLETLDGVGKGSELTESPPDPGGEPLTEVFDHEFWKRVADAFAGAANGLQHAHSRNVLHRDLKPSNLMLGPDGNLRILDFGIACGADEPPLTRTEERLGTLLYMSPEQARGRARDLDISADIYSLGATLYETLVWRPPFSGRNPDEILDRIVRKDPVPLRAINPQIPRGLELIVLKCLRKDAAKRYGTAEALAQDLSRFARGAQVEAEPESWNEKLVRKVRQSGRRIVRTAVAACAILALGALAYGEYSKWQEGALREYEQTVNQAVMHTLAAQVLTPQPIPNTVSSETVPGRRPQDKPPRGSRVAGPTSVSHWMGPELFLAGPRMSGASEESLRQAVTLLSKATDDFPALAIGHYHLGRALLFQGKREAARQSLWTALEQDPGFLPARSLLESLIESSTAEESLRLREEAVPTEQVSSQWPSAWLAAQKAVLEWRWETASEEFDALGAGGEGGGEAPIAYSIETSLTRGVTRVKTGRPIEAVADFASAKGDLPGWLEPRLLLARAFFLSGARPAAESEFKALIDEAEAGGVHSPDDVALAVARVWSDLGEYTTALQWSERISDDSGARRDILRAELFSHQGQMDAALEAAESAVRGERTLAGLLTLGNIRLFREESPAARSVYEEARDLAPDDPRPHLGLATCFEWENQPEEARRELETAASVDRFFAPAYYNLSRVLGALDDFKGARDACIQAVSLAPGDPLAQNNLGAMYDRLGELGKAEEGYKRAVELDPDFALAHYNLGWFLHKQRRYAKAALHYQRALDSGLDDPICHSNLGACLVKLGENERGRSHLELAAEMRLEDSATYHDTGVALYKADDFAGAAEALRKAIELYPKGNDSYKYLGWALEQLKQDAKAEEAYRQGIAAVPGDFRLYNNLGLVLLEQERRPLSEDLRSEILLLECGASLPGADREVFWLLDGYRRDYAPQVASCASVDALFDGEQVLVAEDARWRFWCGRAAEAVSPEGGDLEWTGRDYPHESWQEGAGPFGYPEGPGVATVLSDKTGLPGSVYFRLALRVSDTEAIEKLRLGVRSRDGLVVFLNGREAWRRGLGEAESFLAPEAGAEKAYEHRQPERIELDPALLEDGENVMAVRLVQASFDEPESRLHVRLLAFPLPETERLERAGAALAALQERFAPEDYLPAVYLEGRLLEARGDLSGAVERYREAIALDAQAVESRLRLAALFRREGLPKDAELVLRRGIAAIPDWKLFRLWDPWIELLLVDLKRSPQEILETIPGVLPASEGLRRCSDDVEWLLKRLVSREPIRINCGGKDCEVEGRVWSRDRFSMGGDQSFHHTVSAEAPGLIGPLDLTERYFWQPAPVRPGYRIPLPVGDYAVTVRIMEGHSRNVGERHFEVLLEGEVVLSDYDTVRDAGFGVPKVHVFPPVEVDDGSLNIDFRSLSGNPTIAAIEIRNVKR